MARRLKCPRCGSSKYWIIRGKQRRCAECRYDWRPTRLPLRLTPRQWKRILKWFVRGVSVAAIAEETGLHRQRVLRALNRLRETIAREVTADFHGMQVDELYLLGNGRKKEPIPVSKAHGGLGIIYYEGKIWIRTRDVGLPIARHPVDRLRVFLSYLRRGLAGKGGIRRERLFLYLAEHAWRYNHRRLSQQEQVRELLKMLRRNLGVGG